MTTNTNPPIFLTSEEEITFNLSTDTIAFLDDIPGFDDAETRANLWDYHIANATDVVLAHCQRFATLEKLANNRWARARATELARNELFTVDGEPYIASFAMRAEKALEWLEQVKEKEIDIPGMDDNQDELKSSCPVLSNIIVDPQDPANVLVSRYNSTGNPAGYPVRRDPRRGL